MDGDGTPAGVTFDVRNDYDQQVTITDVRVDPQQGRIKRLSDPSSGEGKWESEVYVEADVRNGVHDTPDGSDLPRTFDMDRFWWRTTQSVEPVLSGGSTATFYLHQFRENPGERQSDVTGSPVDIQFTYRLANGTTGTDSTTVTPTGA
ncbi:hypothetical protein [Halorussus caseinilyticus]|uniref:Uncharacterized protein n=1 Tax=Halorussus caseinilyticus TaxID=3034025 RepID=A0ABD5WKN5_9EURY